MTIVTQLQVSSFVLSNLWHNKTLPFHPTLLLPWMSTAKKFSLLQDFHKQKFCTHSALFSHTIRAKTRPFLSRPSLSLSPSLLSLLSLSFNLSLAAPLSAAKSAPCKKQNSMSRETISTHKIIEGFWSHNNRQEFASGIIPTSCFRK